MFLSLVHKLHWSLPAFVIFFKIVTLTPVVSICIYWWLRILNMFSNIHWSLILLLKHRLKLLFLFHCFMIQGYHGIMKWYGFNNHFYPYILYMYVYLWRVGYWLATIKWIRLEATFIQFNWRRKIMCAAKKHKQIL